mmetsp:Transcript_24255/g.82877  ORF Transcript_24255/g.82877 Transcript_24255/m.82877 type:complete len:253 (-) Transcript_24255:838-1596(-)
MLVILFPPGISGWPLGPTATWPATIPPAAIMAAWPCSTFWRLFDGPACPACCCLRSACCCACCCSAACCRCLCIAWRTGAHTWHRESWQRWWWRSSSFDTTHRGYWQFWSWHCSTCSQRPRATWQYGVYWHWPSGARHLLAWRRKSSHRCCLVIYARCSSALFASSGVMFAVEVEGAADAAGAPEVRGCPAAPPCCCAAAACCCILSCCACCCWRCFCCCSSCCCCCGVSARAPCGVITTACCTLPFTLTPC